MIKRLIMLSTVLTIGALAGCKDADIAQFKSLGSRHRITLYSAGGTVIGQWETTGNVSNESNSDGWYFQDAKTGRLIEIAGTMIVEQE